MPPVHTAPLVHAAPLVYAVPDLHGRLDLLEAALRTFPGAHFVVLGDVIDRGPHSLACVRLLLELRAAGRVTLLWGNHEDMAAGTLSHYAASNGGRDLGAYRAALEHFGWWMDQGGRALRREYGNFGVETYPPELVEYLSLLKLAVYVDGDGNIHDEPPPAPSVLACHAAPPVPSAAHPDPRTNALWARPTEGPFALPPDVVWSVHGHTPVRAPSKLGGQVYTDLGAVYTGKLCLTKLSPTGQIEIVVLQGRRAERSGSRPPTFGEALPHKTLDVSRA